MMLAAAPSTPRVDTVTTPYAVICVVGLIACAIDLRWRRIPNVLTLTTALAGLLYHYSISGWDGLGSASLGCVVGLAIFFPFFALGGLGAGDVKLLAAFGAWLGPQQIVMAAMATTILGAIAALILLLVRRRLREHLSNLHALLAFWMVSGPRPHPGMTLGTASSIRLAYALPITAGALATLWL
jgi:prepilin peptidase CpaA